MLTLPIYQVDAFATAVFRGNPAAVVPLGEWLPDQLLQQIAGENNLSETAFFVERKGRYYLRWFSPLQEVPLCGHATLASAFVLFRVLGKTREVEFDSLSGPLRAIDEGNAVTLDFPRVPVAAVVPPPEPLVRGLGRVTGDVLRMDDDPNYCVVLSSEDEVRALRPDLSALAELHPRGTIVTAPGRTADFVSRYFAPGYGIPEDPVTGANHCMLAPFWAERLGKRRLVAHQASARGGDMICTVSDDRVALTGEAHLYLQGTLVLP